VRQCLVRRAAHCLARLAYTFLLIAAISTSAVGSARGERSYGNSGNQSSPSAQQTSQPSQGNQGLQSGWAVDNAGHYDEGELLYHHFAKMKAAGAGWVRINFRLGACFQDWVTPGCATAAADKTALGVYDQVVAEAAKQNLRIVGLLSNESWRGSQNDWTKAAIETHKEQGTGDNPYIRDFSVKAAATLADHYKGTIDHWEVWNEPNASTAPRGWAGKEVGGSFIYPSNFAWLLKRCYDEITKVNGNAVVISGRPFSYEGASGEE
jgi:hypothetical protein